ncbi:MAG: sigma-70 family RNA polymerase sigma factor [Sandaracinaceae bacterium]|nr:sigma-70 family RNA polymerase sigma factor [Sandaracinaceae bacterium]
MGGGDLSDDELIGRVASGDRTALAELYDRHSAIMLALGVRILGQRGDAEELLHDVFVEAWQRAGDFDPSRGSGRTWLLLRMRSRCLDRLKSAARSRTRPASDRLEHLAGVVEAAAPAQSDGARAVRALASLPDEQREVLELGYFAGLTCSEMADSLGVPIGTVKSRLHTAMKKLRSALVEEP